EPAAHALMTAAFNLRTARHLGGAHDDADQISARSPWWDAPGVDISVTLFKRGKAPTPGVPQPARNNPAVKAELARRQAEQRAAERAAARSLLDNGAQRRADHAPSTQRHGQHGRNTARHPAPARLRAGAHPSEPRAEGLSRMPPQPAAAVQLSDLGSYQSAVRLVLTHDVITATRPRPGTLDQVLRWADQLAKDLRDVLGYTLIATTRQVRLIRRLDALDPTQTTIFTAKSGRSFDRRRLAYLCLFLA